MSTVRVVLAAAFLATLCARAFAQTSDPAARPTSSAADGPTLARLAASSFADAPARPRALHWTAGDLIAALSLVDMSSLPATLSASSRTVAAAASDASLPVGVTPNYFLLPLGRGRRQAALMGAGSQGVGLQDLSPLSALNVLYTQRVGLFELTLHGELTRSLLDAGNRGALSTLAWRELAAGWRVGLLAKLAADLSIDADDLPTEVARQLALGPLLAWSLGRLSLSASCGLTSVSFRQRDGNLLGSEARVGLGAQL